MYQELIHQQKLTKINKNNIRKSSKIVDHDYKVGKKVMLTNNYAFKYEIPHNIPFEVNQCWTNGTVTLQCGTIKIMQNICYIKPYTSDTNIEYIKC